MVGGMNSPTKVHYRKPTLTTLEFRAYRASEAGHSTGHKLAVALGTSEKVAVAALYRAFEKNNELALLAARDEAGLPNFYYTTETT